MTQPSELTRIWAEIGKLFVALQYDEQEGRTMLPDGTPVSTCTNSARYLQKIIGGKIVGYHHYMNQAATVGKDEGGHDFIVTPDYLVDFWNMDTYEGPAVLRRKEDAALIRQMYGTKWVEWDEAKKRFVPSTEGEPQGIEKTRHYFERIGIEVIHA